MKNRYSKFFVIQYPKTSIYYNRREGIDGLIGESWKVKESSTYLRTPADATKYVSEKGANKAIGALVEKEHRLCAEAKVAHKKDPKWATLYDPEPHLNILRACVVKEVQGDPMDHDIEFSAWCSEDYIANRRPHVGTNNKKSQAYCACCGLRIPRHMPYLGGRFRTDICIICLNELVPDVLRAYEKFAKDFPQYIENYRSQSMIRKL